MTRHARVRFLSGFFLAGILVSVPVLSAESDLERKFQELETGQAAEPAKSLEALEKILPPGDAQAQRRYWRLYCWNHDFGKDNAAAVRYATEHRLLAEKAGDRMAAADLLLCRGYYQQLLGNITEAYADYDRMIEESRQGKFQQLLADGLSTRGELRSYQGDLMRALEDLLEAQRLYEAAHLDYWATQNLGQIANTYRKVGDYDKSLEYYHQEQKVFEAEKSMLGLAGIYNEIGQVFEDQGRYQEALRNYQKAYEFSKKAPTPAVPVPVLVNMGSTLVHLKRYDEALERFAEARKGLPEATPGGAWALMNLFEGMALSGKGRLDEALQRFSAAEPLIRQDGNLRYLAWLQDARAAALAAKGNHDMAYQELRRYIATHVKLDDLLREQSSARLRIAFDTERKEAENRRLLNEQSLKDRELSALQEARRWQSLVMILGGILFFVLLVLGVRQIQRARRLHVLAMTDELTQLPNRRHIQTLGKEAITRARTDNTPLSVLVFDIDYFKRINDGYGHLVGDQVLSRVAHASQAVLRQFDRVGRTGGEEFLVILPGTPLEKAAQVAERLRAGVAALSMSDIAEDLVVTISIGVAELIDEDADLRALSRRADNALYRAKAAGRNRVEIER